DASRDAKSLTIDVVPGPVLLSRIDVKGNSALSTEQVLNVVNAGGALSAWLDPHSVERLLENHYHSDGFLAAKVSVSGPMTRDGPSVVAIDVAEGGPYSIGRIELSGLPETLDAEARDALVLSAGARYRPADVAEGVNRLETRLRQASYLEGSVDVETALDRDAAHVDISFRVTPGRRSILRDVVVQGGDLTKPLVARAITLQANAPLDPAAISETRQRLYDLDTYRSVDIDVQPLSTAAPPTSVDATLEQPVVARIAL